MHIIVQRRPESVITFRNAVSLLKSIDIGDSKDLVRASLDLESFAESMSVELPHESSCSAACRWLQARAPCSCHMLKSI